LGGKSQDHGENEQEFWAKFHKSGESEPDLNIDDEETQVRLSLGTVAQKRQMKPKNPANFFAGL
jgi:hypothetical protein